MNSNMLTLLTQGIYACSPSQYISANDTCEDKIGVSRLYSPALVAEHCLTVLGQYDDLAQSLERPLCGILGESRVALLFDFAETEEDEDCEMDGRKFYFRMSIAEEGMHEISDISVTAVEAEGVAKFDLIKERGGGLMLEVSELVDGDLVHTFFSTKFCSHQLLL
jgi:hypothetical protein